MDKQIEADGGQMFMHLATVPSEEGQRAASAQELEEKIAQAVQTMREAIKTDDDAQFRAAAQVSGQSQELWLIVAQRMTPEQARATMIDFAQNEMTRWMQERIPGPPPLILDRYKQEP